MSKIGAENLCVYVFLSLLLFEHLSKFHVSKNYGAQKIGFSADYLTAHLRDRWLFCSRELLVHEKRFIFGGENSFRFSATAQMRETLVASIRRPLREE